MGVLDAENNPIFADMENEPQPVHLHKPTSKKIWLSKTSFFKNHQRKNQLTKHSTLKMTKKILNRSKVLPIVPTPCQMGFGVIIGAIIGGLVVQSLTPSHF